MTTEEETNWDKFEDFLRENRSFFTQRYGYSEKDCGEMEEFFKWCKIQGMGLLEVQEKILKFAQQQEVKNPS